MVSKLKEKEEDYIRKYKEPFPQLYQISINAMAEVVLGLSMQNATSNSAQIVAIINFLSLFVNYGRYNKLSDISTLVIQIFSNATNFCSNLLEGNFKLIEF